VEFSNLIFTLLNSLVGHLFSDLASQSANWKVDVSIFHFNCLVLPQIVLKP
jgi:hypothetical protein